MKAIYVIVRQLNRKVAATFYSHEDMMGENDEAKLSNARILAIEQFNQDTFLHGDGKQKTVDNALAEIQEFAEPECIVDGHNGVYTPQVFAQRYAGRLAELTHNLERDGVPHDHSIMPSDIEALSDPSNEFYWEAWQDITDHFFIMAMFNGKATKFVLFQDDDLFLVQDGVPLDEDFGMFTMFPEPVEVTTITHGKTKWWLKKIDSTHLYMSNKEGEYHNALHVGQLNGYPYYKDIAEWLHDGLDLNNKNYD